MRNRQPTKILENGAVRYAVYDESGAFLRHEYMLPDDEPTDEGDVLAKETLLQDDTTAIMGLSTTAVPNDAFAALGKYLAHWWRRRNLSGRYVQSDGSYTNLTLLWSDNSNTNETFLTSDSIAIDQSNGAVNLVNPSSVVVNLGSASSARNLLGKYFKSSLSRPSQVAAGVVYYADPSVNPTISHPYAGEDLLSVSAKRISSAYETVPSAWEYIFSADRNAYPDSGTVSNVEYQYCGQPLENAITASGVVTGSYSGTGTYGSGNKNQLTVPESAQACFIGGGKAFMMLVKGKTNGVLVYYLTVDGAASASVSAVTVSWSGSTLQWYSTSALMQGNTSGAIYNYAIL